MKRLIQRGLLLVALITGWAFHLSAQSTLMTIHMNDGSERSYYMTENDRVYFGDNETLVVEIVAYSKGERTDRFNLVDIRKITCADTEHVIEENFTNVFLSPNPVHDVIMLRNLNGRETIRIYSMDGRLMKSTEASEGTMIDISDLSIGLYLLKTEHQTLKMIKL